MINDRTFVLTWYRTREATTKRWHQRKACSCPTLPHGDDVILSQAFKRLGRPTKGRVSPDWREGGRSVAIVDEGELG